MGEPGHSRRALLKGVGGLVAACPFAASVARAEPHVTDAPLANHASQDDRTPFYGARQAGVVTPRPAHGMVASFAVVADDADALEALFRRLTERIAFLTAGGPVPVLDPKLPPADSGLLGPVARPDGLTVTVALGASLFDDRPWLRPLKPKRLTRMTRFPNDALNADLCHGDLTLQICANSQDATIHALRDIIKSIPDQLILSWKQEGAVPVVAPGPDGTAESARNFLGFRDGSANPDSRDEALMDRVVWVGAGDGEPDWATGGSYQAVRIIRNFVERWDRTPLGEQERIMGRSKMTGAPLDKLSASEFVGPDYAQDRDGRLTPLDSHIRLANPRDAKSDANLILRRPFNYSNGVTRSGQLDQGLLFICYQADLDAGFISVQRRLDGEPLEEYVKPVGGGYFYVLPGVETPSDHLGRALVAAAREPRDG
ncbi:Tat-translocated enzyme [Methylopila jiangsuensis]|uniref:Deferrochelatase n=1 Tax=Methylopila jiangsuensis TaxID=586230 RepID=A0A9W6JEQ2_9HYPH|nr:iron uptake transporter deferrochelatase/peroxidase subunit [Methylopila jiangsuensis]MDR6284253.1 deferrochelatase/peroxidase EfeB [Methylopila jiangsuensis]GLK76230.1 Tat-translocated enzyme [Methylopila jiangsuensis]